MKEKHTNCGFYTTTVEIAHENGEVTNPLTAEDPATGSVNLISTAETTLGEYTVTIKVTRSFDGTQSIKTLSVMITDCLDMTLKFTLTTTSVTHEVQVDPDTHDLISSTN